jgi:dimeric dUTPase (all-alpha-NTP-PPase superfamily)
MKIINWDKLRYKFIILAGMDLAIDTTYTTEDELGKTTYCFTMCDSDSVGETFIEVFLKEGEFDEFLMSVNLPQQQITPNIKRVFRRKDLLDINEFMKQMGSELVKNSMVNSYLNFLSGLKQTKLKASNNTFASHSINLPF